MKTATLSIIFTFASILGFSAITLDSLKVVKLGDTTYGLGIYGLLTSNPPCTIVDSSKTINGSNIYIGLCYLSNGSQGIVCKATDTIFIGVLSQSSYTITLFASVTDSPLTNTCYSTTKRDTFEVVHSTTDVTSYETSYADVSPNPAPTQLTLTIPPPTQPTTAIITDINGRLLRKEQLLNATNTLNIAELPAGLYFVTVQNEEQRWVRRFVKQ